MPSNNFYERILHFWNLDAPSKGERNHCEVLPDGCVDLVFEITRRGLKSYLFGTSTRSYNFQTKVDAGYFGVRFRQGIVPILEDYKPIDLVDSHLDLSFSLKNSFDIQSISFSSTTVDKTKFLEKILNTIQYKPKTPLLKRLSCYSIEVLLEDGVMELIKSLGLSRRQLERNFKNDFGISIYKFQRICRFQYAKNLLQTSKQGITDIALESGYYDHSHMINEFKNLSGHLPKSFR